MASCRVWYDTICNSVTNIGVCAFALCDGLVSVTIGNSVNRIGFQAFDSCDQLTSITIPNSVTTIEDNAFLSCYGLTNVTIGNGITNIGICAFGYCSPLESIYFFGNAPSVGTNVFTGTIGTLYYLPGTTGWGAPGTLFGGRPKALWFLPNPLILNGPSFGVRTNQFGFIISWATNIPIVVEACTNLAGSAWVPLQSCTLTNGSLYFSDPDWTNHPGRFYRLRSP